MQPALRKQTGGDPVEGQCSIRTGVLVLLHSPDPAADTQLSVLDECGVPNLITNKDDADALERQLTTDKNEIVG